MMGLGSDCVVAINHKIYAYSVYLRSATIQLMICSHTLRTSHVIPSLVCSDHVLMRNVRLAVHTLTRTLQVYELAGHYE